MIEPATPVPPHAFDEAGATAPARRRPLSVVPLHVRLEVRLDPRQGSFDGRVTHRFRGLHAETRRLTLDAVDMTVTAAWHRGRPLQFVLHGEAVELLLNEPLGLGDETSVSLDFQALPGMGMHFVGPTADDPNRRPQAWTQGAMEDHHHWFPCFDAPQHMVTTEVIAEVPQGFQALSNGEPIAIDDATAPNHTGYSRFHWRMDQPHALYLLTLVVDQVVEVIDATGVVPLHHYVPAGREADARTLFQRLPQMLDALSSAIGHPYPFSRYGHVFLQEFMWGGMENSTLTSLTDQVLIAGEHREEEDVERLFAHELAHQWFGDLIAPRGWPEIWLNESFATYFELLCMGTLNGADDQSRRLQVLRDAYLGEARSRYARAVVTRRYAHPYVLFDKHAYEKGALVLHTLRDQLGDALFFAGVHRYVSRCAGTAAETAELRRAFEDVSGADLTDFFEQLVYAAAHPSVRISWRLQAGLGLEVTLERLDSTQTELALTLEIGGHGRRRVPLAPSTRTLFLELDTPPTYVALDPDAACLVEIDETSEADVALRSRLRTSGSAALRARSCRLLGDRGTTANRCALAEALNDDASEATRIEAARALGAHRSAAARAVLLGHLMRGDTWRVRATAARALGIGADESLVDVLEPRMSAESSHRVRCGYLRALGDVTTEASRALIRRALDTASPRDCISAAAVAALSFHDEASTVDEIMTRLAPKYSRSVRCAAAAGIARVGHANRGDAALYRRTRLRLEALLGDSTFAVRHAAIEGLRDLGDVAARPALERRHAAEPFALIRRTIREALGVLTQART